MILYNKYTDYQRSGPPPLEGLGEVKASDHAGYISNNAHTCKLINEIPYELKSNPSELEGLGEGKASDHAGYISNNAHTCKLINEIPYELKSNPSELEGLGEVKASDDAGYISNNAHTCKLINEIPDELKSNPSELEGLGEVKDSGDPGYITANPYTYKFIKEIRDGLKSNPTEAELVLWEYLKSKKTGHKIRRQHIIDDFISDFVCLRKKVVIELDGKIHDFQKEYDEMRTSRLNELGFEVIRFKNVEVLGNPEKIRLKIKDYLDQRPAFDLSPALPEGKGDV